MRAFLLLFAALAAASVQAAGPAYMVRDIKVETQSDLVEFGTLGEFVAFDGFVYFGQNDGVHGFEPWRWSPATGPELFADICPGACWSLPWNFVEWGGYLYFAAAGTGLGREVWRTDGTAAGTNLVADVAPGSVSSYPLWLTPGPGALYFVADDGDGDVELWKTDGTAAGTARVADIRPGPQGSRPGSLVQHDGLLYFTADDGVHGLEIWRTDGTAVGTSLLADLCPHAGQCVWLEQWYYDRRNAIVFVGDMLFAPLSGGGGLGLASIDLASGEVQYLEPGRRLETGSRFVGA
jgi:ELWxxDGT repeat protein